MHVSNIGPGDEVITQAVSFVATANAISYCGAKPIFIDVDLDTLSMSPTALLDFLQTVLRLTLAAHTIKIVERELKRVCQCTASVSPHGLPKSLQYVSSLILL